MIANARTTRFVIVGAMGFAIQIFVLWALTSLADWSWLPAIVAAVELTIVHNFVWHDGWTWRRKGFSGFSRLLRFARFNVAMGATSIGGNVVLMGIFIGALGMSPVIANVITVGLMSAANFLVSDRWVFNGRRANLKPGAVSAVIALMMSASLDANAAPGHQTMTAWTRYVVETETRLDRARGSAASDLAPRGLLANGASVDVPGGTISHWRGSAFIPGITLDRLLNGLQHPGTPPPQEDVVSSHVISRSGDSLRVFIRLVRHAIVTVSYDTEHEMTFRRWTPSLATARSVATRIEEVGGGDHGFLWRLNSYWRYEERHDGVLVELESLTLSRDMPSLLRPVAGPLVRRIARESMVRTLEALKRQYQAG